MDLNEVSARSHAIRQKYHMLEEKHHGSRWSVEEDALAFLTDAALVGRLTMDKQGRWPKTSNDELAQKIGESVWWLATLAERTGLSLEECVEKFLTEKEAALKCKSIRSVPYEHEGLIMMQITYHNESLVLFSSDMICDTSSYVLKLNEDFCQIAFC